MNTEKRIKEIAEELRNFIKYDNDAPRFIQEQLGDLVYEPEDNRDEIVELEEKIERLEEIIEDARNALG